jgi:hypothetical protein
MDAGDANVTASALFDRLKNPPHCVRNIEDAHVHA